MRRRRRGIVAAVIAVGIFVALLALGRDRTPDLLAHANFIADTTDWAASQWMDDRRLLVLTWNGKTSAFILDTATGKRQELPGVGATLSGIKGSYHRTTSPDGRWMLVSPWQSMPDTRLLISTEDGRVVRRFRSGVFVGWLPDSSGWVAGRGKNARGISLYRPDGAVHDYPAASFTPGPGVDLAITKSERWLYGVYNPYERDPLKIHELDLRSGQSRVKKSIGLPPSCLLSAPSMSREQTHLFWQVRPMLSSSKLIDMLFGWIGDQEPQNVVWVSKSDGSDMRMVGGAKVEYGTDYDTNLGVEWIPGGKYLAVTYGRKLYKVPIE